MFHTTFDGIEKWFCHNFEILGWMLLAQRDGRTYKVRAYKKGIKCLTKAIEERIKITSDPDRIIDLQQLHYNMKTLQEATDTLFPSCKKM